MTRRNYVLFQFCPGLSLSTLMSQSLLAKRRR